mmetsp:Transcript_56142/g.154754  ORF Transcript_56142/g.154754 Transcript_56142/m.154754 type:complete len:92 (+) Transcript_56142:169-444(+)
MLCTITLNTARRSAPTTVSLSRFFSAAADRVSVAGLQVDSGLYEFVESELCNGTGKSADQVFTSLSTLLDEFAPRNAELLETRKSIQVSHS